jgi:hypothetical protein
MDLAGRTLAQGTSLDGTISLEPMALQQGAFLLIAEQGPHCFRAPFIRG